MRRCFPLYYDLRIFYSSPDLSTAHVGLLFDRFVDIWSGPEKWKPEKPKKKNELPPELDFLKKVISFYQDNKDLENNLQGYLKRRRVLLQELKGDYLTFRSDWRFITGLGMAHVLETGFMWHPILGVPYLPASSVKGLAKACLSLKANEKKNQEQEELKKEIEELFGTPDRAGQLLVFDALPSQKPKLEVDIMNPHYSDYYTGKMQKRKSGDRHTPPADYLSPNPIFFLAVAGGSSFEFALAPRDPGKSPLLKRGFEILEQALTTLGAGAKTAVGYGYFQNLSGST